MAIMYKDGDKMRKIAKVMYLDPVTNTIKTMGSCKGLVDGVLREFLPQAEPLPEKIILPSYEIVQTMKHLDKVGDTKHYEITAPLPYDNNIRAWVRMAVGKYNLQDKNYIVGYRVLTGEYMVWVTPSFALEWDGRFRISYEAQYSSPSDLPYVFSETLNDYTQLGSTHITPIFYSTQEYNNYVFNNDCTITIPKKIIS